MNNEKYLVIPASGIGARMNASIPKQYLTLNGQTVLQTTVNRLAPLGFKEIIIAVSSQDRWFDSLDFNVPVTKVVGGKERVDSVLNALKTISDPNAWVLVHDAARPCVQLNDVNRLVDQCLQTKTGGILAVKVSDTVKKLIPNNQQTISTIDRSNLWLAQTPQCFQVDQLTTAINDSLAQGVTITDEASAIEAQGLDCQIIEGNRSNIKITMPEDLELAIWYTMHKAKK